MNPRHHLEGRECCPYLPSAPKVICAAETRPLRNGADQAAYYIACLSCAQSLWLEGKPAQALLQLNHALAVDLPIDSAAADQWPLPYQAKIWILTRHQEPGFLGNPVRHYQHLATRVSGPLREIRSWRAWACFHLAEGILPHDAFPRDQRQIIQENLILPTWEEVLSGFHADKKSFEAAQLNRLMLESCSHGTHLDRGDRHG
ncbi:MAG: hypothetical protein KJO21_08970 [Verrucomicrobiae bacterium]|nr:hypothetical protein [Verrucomicrobiae bacterium]NNJ42305.1 hypothetical protein [Akkermansiaceae bacterium]